jgi:hypothetical protein
MNRRSHVALVFGNVIEATWIHPWYVILAWSRVLISFKHYNLFYEWMIVTLFGCLRSDCEFWSLIKHLPFAILWIVPARSRSIRIRRLIVWFINTNHLLIAFPWDSDWAILTSFNFIRFKCWFHLISSGCRCIVSQLK